MIMYCGDSHTRPFTDTNFEHNEDDQRLLRHRLVWRPGATAGGFSRLHSTRKLRQMFQNATARKLPNIVCFNLGQVDVDLGFYFACMKNGKLNFEDWVSERYETYIAHCATIDTNVVIKGLNPSCLVTDERIRAYVRRNTMGVYKDRAQFRGVYRPVQKLMNVEQHSERNVVANTVLSNLCKKHQLRFFDVRSETQSADLPGMARSEFVALKLDVHLNNSIALFHAYRSGLLRALSTSPTSG